MRVMKRGALPVACTLTPGAGAARLTAWSQFNDDYLLGMTRAAGSMTLHYAKDDDAIMRLAELARAEQSCCTFADWAIDTGQPDLLLRVSADEDVLSTLTFMTASHDQMLGEDR